MRWKTPVALVAIMAFLAIHDLCVAEPAYEPEDDAIVFSLHLSRWCPSSFNFEFAATVDCVAPHHRHTSFHSWSWSWTAGAGAGECILSYEKTLPFPPSIPLVGNLGNILGTCALKSTEACGAGALGCESVDISFNGLGYDIEADNMVFLESPPSIEPSCYAGAGCNCPGGRRFSQRDNATDSKDEVHDDRHAGHRARAGVAVGTANAALAGYYYDGNHEELPANLWRGKGYVHIATATFMDRNTGRVIAQGKMQLTLPDYDATFTQITPAQLGANDIVIRQPNRMTFTAYRVARAQHEPFY